MTDKELSQAAQEGARNVEDAFERLGAEVCCGQCYCMAEEVIDTASAAPPVKTQSPGAYVAQAAE